MNPLHFEGVGMTSKRTRERLIARLVEQGIRREDVLEVISHTPRHIFLDEALSHRAYEDTALPIGYGQTLSQPYIVARMTELLLDRATCLDRVLEIGTGSGYQTAVLAQCVKDIWTVERIQPLQAKARSKLRQLGIRNVRFHYADGGLGWPEHAPFDAILSAAAPRTLPDSLQQQLAPNGVLIIPLGADTQYLTVVQREGDSDEFHVERLEAVRFVPLLSGTSR